MTSELTKALCGFYKDVAVIHKDAKAQYGKFADLATVLTAVTPALAKNGLACPQTFRPSDDGSQTLLITTLLHTSGESVQSEVPMMVNAGRNVLHDFGGAVTYLRRYALLAILGLAADVDTDGDCDEPKAKPQAAPKAAPAPAPKPQAAPEPAPTAEVPTDLPVDPDQLEGLLSTVVASPNKAAIIAEARKVLGLAADAKIKPSITTQSQFDALLKICLEHE